VGRKSASETLVKIVGCFHERRQWSQADLARHLKTDVRIVRAKLTELLDAGLPLERIEERPNVFWRLPKDWVPGGVAIPDHELAPLTRIVARAPKTPARERLLARLLAGAPPKTTLPIAQAALVTRELGTHEESQLDLLETAVSSGRAVHIHYLSSTGPSERALSIQRIDVGPPARVAAHCHRTNELRWFRVDRMKSARLDPSTDYQRRPESEVDAFLNTSINGYHGDRAPIHCVFFVRPPDAYWVQKNLPSPMRGTWQQEELRVDVQSSGLEQIARFVVGLGAAARIETAALQELVTALARGALGTV
jgi:predicted DNA-binding transcriptional regulator YafY